MDSTTIHVRRAATGHAESLEWVVSHFSPLLLAQTRWRLGPWLGRLYDPDDLVAEAWLLALPRLAKLPDREGRLTPVLLRFLSTTILYRINNLLRMELRRTPRPPPHPEFSASELPAVTTGIVTAAVRAERQIKVLDALEELEPLDQEILLLRGVEQRSNRTVAEVLDISEAAASARYQRALARLKGRVPRSILEDLE